MLFGFILQALFTSDPVNYLAIIGGLVVSAGIVMMIVFKKEDQSAESDIATIRAMDDNLLIEVTAPYHAML